MWSCPFGSMTGSGPSLMNGFPTSRSQLSLGCEMTYRGPVGSVGLFIRTR